MNTLSFSTAALNAAIYRGQIEGLNSLTRSSTTKPHSPPHANYSPYSLHLEESGARLILIGDPHQNQPVGAGGLWPCVENAVRHSERTWR